MSRTYETVKVEHENGIAWVILNRPDKRNAMSPQLHYDMCEVLDVRQGCAHPHRRRQRHRQCRFLDREGGVPAQKHQGCEPRPYHRLFEQRIIDSVSRRPSMQVTKP